jgi:glycosyltransferase involved in cell wall biosynthesis
MIQSNRSTRFLASAPDLSVVVPVHEEQENVAPLADEIDAALGGVVEYEIVFVDDASTDATFTRLTQLSHGNPRVRVLRHAERYGQSTALHTGVVHARASLIATLDGDGQNDPGDIPRLLSTLSTTELDASRTLVTGYRVKRRDSRLVRLSSRIANVVRSGVLHDGTPDTGCGLKVFDRSLFLELPYFDHMHRFLPALVRRAGGFVVTVPVNHRPRRAGRSHYGVWDRLWTGIIDLVGVMWLTRRAKVVEVTEPLAPSPVVGAIVRRGGRATSRHDSGGSLA